MPQGTLGATSAVDVLEKLVREKFTGVFTIKAPDDTAVLYLDRGNLVDATLDAPAKETWFLNQITKRHHLTPEERTDLRRRMTQHGENLERFLLENELVTEGELKLVRMGLLRQVVLELSTWQAGSYVFTARSVDIAASSRGTRVELEGELALQEMTTRREDFLELFERHAGQGDTIICLAAGPESQDLTPEERVVILHSTDPHTYEDLLDRTSLRPYDLLLALDRLSERGLLLRSTQSPSKENGRPKKPAEVEPPVDTLAPPPRKAPVEPLPPPLPNGNTPQSSTLEKILFLFGRLLRQAEEYPQDHPEVRRSALELLERIKLETSSGRQVSLQVDANTGILIGDSFPLDQDLYQEVASTLGERGLAGVSFQSNLRIEDLLEFVELLRESPHLIMEEGGFQSFLEKKLIHGLSVNETHFRTRFFSAHGHGTVGTAPAELAEVRQVLQSFKGFQERFFANPKALSVLFEEYTRDITLRSREDARPEDELEIFLEEVEELGSLPAELTRSQVDRTLVDLFKSLLPELQVHLLARRLLHQGWTDTNYRMARCLNQDQVKPLFLSFYQLLFERSREKEAFGKPLGEQIMFFLHNLERGKLVAPTRLDEFLKEVELVLNQGSLLDHTQRKEIEVQLARISEMSPDHKSNEKVINWFKETAILLAKTDEHFLFQTLLKQIQSLADGPTPEIRSRGYQAIAAIFMPLLEHGRLRMIHSVTPILKASLAKEHSFKAFALLVSTCGHLSQECITRRQQAVALYLVAAFGEELVKRDTRTIVERKHIVTVLGMVKLTEAQELVVSALEENELFKEAAEALEANLDPLNLEPLLNILRTSDRKNVRMRVIELLEKHGKDVLQPLLKDLKDLRWFIRRNAVQLFGQLKAKEWLREVSALLKDSDRRVRLEALGAVANIQEKDAEPILVQALEDSESEIVREAIKLLSKWGTEKAAKVLAERLPRTLFGLGDLDDDIKGEICFALGAVGSEVAVQALSDLARTTFIMSESKNELQVRAVMALGRIASPRALAVIQELAASKNQAIRQAAQRALNRGGEAVKSETMRVPVKVKA